ncbi:hypothetical protein SNE40_023462 [Patella caerulea]|uniref:Uncharacterized protein n=1 Tax=Patella caerulea TaxID=87958 RepID=A0AAN8GA68_PATCE
MASLKEGVFSGRAYHTRLVPHPHRFTVPISLELKRWNGDDIPTAAFAKHPDEIWRMSTLKYLGYDYSPILYYFLFSTESNSFTHVYINTPSLDGALQCYDFPLVQNKGKTNHIEKTGDISPLGVKIAVGSHSYQFVFESDFMDYFFVRIDTFVNKRPHMKCVMKVQRQVAPSLRNYLNGSSWLFKLRTLCIAFVLYFRGLFIDRGWINEGMSMKKLLQEIKSSS